ncbi:MAG: hypothetical protein NC548_26905 [Lachnospiraceae bacterium]|nr:hypothetical protein [Lachnospiraceae bacterium]
MRQSLFHINHRLCTVYPGLDPIRLLDHPCEDVFDLINGLLDYGGAESGKKEDAPDGVEIITRPADDSWF